MNDGNRERTGHSKQGVRYDECVLLLSNPAYCDPDFQCSSPRVSLACLTTYLANTFTSASLCITRVIHISLVINVFQPRERRKGLPQILAEANPLARNFVRLGTSSQPKETIPAKHIACKQLSHRLASFVTTDLHCHLSS
jgi:hypothetical protein